MAAIKPRDGEHPLGTKCRMLHRELAWTWALLAVAGFCLSIQSFAQGDTLFGLIGVALWVAFCWFASGHYRWSR